MLHRSHGWLSTSRWLVSAVMLFGCLEPLASDDPEVSPRIFGNSYEVPHIEDNPTDLPLVNQLRDNDGVDDFVPRKPAYAEGEDVFYWDFGSVRRGTAPAWTFRRCDDEGMPLPPPEGSVDHPILWETIPGARDYSPYWRVITVCVTNRYAGEKMTSLAAIRDGVRIGIVSEPVTTSRWFNCPIVAPGVEVEVGGEEPSALAGESYYRGRIVPYFTFSFFTLPESGGVQTANVYRLKMEGASTFLERPIFQWKRPQPGMSSDYSEMSVVVEVTLAAGADPTMFRKEEDMFRRDAQGKLQIANPKVSSFMVTTNIVNWPQQRQEGSL